MKPYSIISQRFESLDGLICQAVDTKPPRKTDNKARTEKKSTFFFYKQAESEQISNYDDLMQEFLADLAAGRNIFT